jgi:hypothetical protein
MKLPITLLYLFLISHFAIAQSSYIRQATVSSNTKMSSAILISDTIPYKPIESWVGKQFLFAPIHSNKQQYGYTEFKGGTGMEGRPSYEECFGKVATVTDFKTADAEFELKVKLNDSGKEYTARTRNGVISRIVFLEDMDSAKARYENNTYYMKRDLLYTWDEAKDKVGISNNHKFAAMKVKAIYASFDDNAPVQLWLVNAKGEEGFININLSNTNVDASLKNKSVFSYYFYKKSPRVLCNCNPEVWSLIVAHQVQQGMTLGQAKMSWGDPLEIIQLNETKVKYKYSNGGFLIFENNLLIEMAQ